MKTLKPWRTLKRRLLLERSPWMRVYEDDVVLPDGQTICGYLHLDTPGYAMIVPVDRQGQIGLVRSYKRGVDGIDLQPPAGVLTEDEAPLACAQRELLEETGSKAERFHHLASPVISGNYYAGKAHIYLAVGCQVVAEPDSGDLEEQQVVWMPSSEVYKKWISGSFQQISTLAALGLAFARIESLQLDSPGAGG
jgi:ADP-ribose pyrophosphatase